VLINGNQQMKNTSASIAEPVALFLFAHQDDETGIFQKIVDEVQLGHRVCCAFLTDGVVNGGSAHRRNQESLSVLKQLGVHGQDIFFAGTDLSIPDTGLPEHLETAANWMHKWLSGFSQVESIYVLAWEGGHPDHDALHAIAVTIAAEMGLSARVRQFLLYNGYGCVAPFFRVFIPLSLNGRVEKTAISWRNRLKFLRYCLSYPSQAKTWAGLFPFVVFHYLFNGKQLLQSVSTERIQQRPHEGRLYYESRGFSTWGEMSTRLYEWRKADQSVISKKNIK